MKIHHETHKAHEIPMWTYLLLASPILLAVGTGLRAEEKVSTNMSASVVWTLDSVASIGGVQPEVLGAPKVVDVAAGGPALQFNGQNDGLVLPVNPIAGWAQFTIEALLRPETDGPLEQRFLHIEDERSSRALLETRIIQGKSWALDTLLLCGDSSRPLLDRTKLHPTGKWTWVALRYDGKTMAHYINGVKELEGEVVFAPMTIGRISLGVRQNRVFWFKGCLKEVRFHPTALKPEALQRVTEK